ncbi:alpha/beta fold hydrolase [Kitasatospora sp. NPDC052896]|uniref:alpha/beta fold hydrolase n=1 Tax=Kitasatospora sp. NPDC052896 TaxID=3364061 RepID=UPI0037C764F9
MPTVRVDDLTMYYERHGAGAPLLLIGGLGGDLTMLDALVRRLARRHEVIVFDNRGAGRTDQPDTPYTVELLTRDAAGLLAALHVPRAHLLGISMGGRIALELALSRPELVDHLVLVSTAATGRGRLTVSAPMRLVGVLKRLGVIRRRHPQSAAAFGRQLAASIGYDAADRLHLVRAPTLILHGRRDRSIPVGLAERLHQGVPGSRLRLFPGGHLFFLLGQRERALDEVERFLS